MKRVENGSCRKQAATKAASHADADRFICDSNTNYE